MTRSVWIGYVALVHQKFETGATVIGMGPAVSIEEGCLWRAGSCIG